MELGLNGLNLIHLVSNLSFRASKKRLLTEGGVQAKGEFV